MRPHLQKSHSPFASERAEAPLSAAAFVPFSARRPLHWGRATFRTESQTRNLSNSFPPMGWGTAALMPPEIGRDDPLNLSISVSGGKETNKDSLSNGE